MAFSMFSRPESVYARVSGSKINSDYELSSLGLTAASNSKPPLGIDEPSSWDTVETEYSSTYPRNVPRAINRRKRFWSDRWRFELGMGRYFRLYDPDDQSSTFRGWRKAVIAAAAVAGFVLAINTVFVIVTLVKFDTDEGVGIIYSGDCGLVKRWDTSLHLLINVLGTALLAASSFTMQCLSSPTRSEVDKAHAKRVSLEIGLASFYNLFYVKWWKAVTWLLLCLSTMPLHLLWNSTVFSTISTNAFSLVVADQSFLEGASYLQPNTSVYCSSDDTTLAQVIPTIYNGYSMNKYASLTAKECLDYYNNGLVSNRRNLIVIVQQPTTSDLMTECGYRNVPWNGSSVVGIDINATPDSGWATSFDYGNTVDLSTLQKEVKSKGTWSLGTYTVESCQSEIDVTPQCELQFMSYILYVVVACNFVKFVCMCLAARYLWSLDEPILATIGDATSSFLERPDETTKGLCLIDAHDISAGVWKRSTTNATAYNPTYRRKLKRRLYSATTHTRWWVTIILCTLYLIAGWVLWALSLSQLSGYTFGQSMKLKFGAIDANLVLDLSGDSGGALLVDVIVANSFQVALSTTYFLYNSLYTAQCGALEWVSYIQGKRKSLRVTWPRDQQRSTYYLQLPYRYGIPLTALLVLMHFLISQSIFLARLQYYDWQGQLIDDASFSDVGFSPRATFTTCLVGAVMILAQVVHACRPLDNRMPIHGNSSAVMSAMCHPRPPVEDDSKLRKFSSIRAETENISCKQITWGVTKHPIHPAGMDVTGSDLTRDGAGHCGFSADMVELPEMGNNYR